MKRSLGLIAGSALFVAAVFAVTVLDGHSRAFVEAASVETAAR